jgi:Tfp pilus assembly protein PilE
MSRRVSGERGLSLVEVTIILVVLSVLTAAVAPAAGSYIEGARNTKAKNDVESIGSAIDLLLRNTGVRCVSKAPTNAMTPTNTAPCSLSNRVELLVSGSSVAANKPTVVTTAFAASASTASAVNVNWSGGTSEVADASKNLMDAHLVTNTTGYTVASFTGGGGPKTGVGWRGAYLNGPLDVDPWGYAYQANTLFLTAATDATDGTAAGQRRGGWSSDVMVISAGSNGVVQTAFGATGGAAVGDDVAYVLQGSTH